MLEPRCGKQQYVKALCSSFPKNGHIAWFDPQTKKLESHCITKQTAAPVLFSGFPKNRYTAVFLPQTYRLTSGVNNNGFVSAVVIVTLKDSFLKKKLERFHNEFPYGGSIDHEDQTAPLKLLLNCFKKNGHTA